MEEKKESSLLTSCCSEGEIKSESEMKSESEVGPTMEWKLEETNWKGEKWKIPPHLLLLRKCNKKGT